MLLISYLFLNINEYPIIFWFFCLSVTISLISVKEIFCDGWWVYFFHLRKNKPLITCLNDLYFLSPLPIILGAVT